MPMCRHNYMYLDYGERVLNPIHPGHLGSKAMPKCRSDQRPLAIGLVVMVTVETLLIFAVMHWEHQAAEEDAEFLREEQRRARDDSIEEEQGWEDLEEEWVEGLVRRKRESSPRIKQQDQKNKSEFQIGISRTVTLHDEKFRGIYDRKNPKIRKVALVKKMGRDSAREGSWLAEPLPRANKRVFTKGAQSRRKHSEGLHHAKKMYGDVELGVKSTPSARSGIRTGPQVVNLYRDITSL
ncbi:hypothetical protein EGW08_011492 [Elysia chlorotica]|uniref:Uncharacterized protein n=1 Tax=Elysia chlorotica TaxID=188477 RepID=A0A433TGV7_ELYCH|nr:hypothetical protein EGW08_011492 [Elysia chlorotica]